jgi:cell filamentation protein
MSNRYAVPGAEGEFEPGSGDSVLRNIRGITSLADMDELELSLLGQLVQVVLKDELPMRALRVADLRDWHRWWLGNVYAWAGQDRTVNMSKGGFAFAAAAQVPRLLNEFERTCLARWTPCEGLPWDELVEALAVTHVEFILIHPFREGNGRLSRLLSDVMAVQAGYWPLDYSLWAEEKTDYIRSIHAGMAGNYEPMKAMVTKALLAGNTDVNEPV